MKENYFNCIYMYVNKINNHKYIGKAKDFNRRHKQHLNGNKLLIDKKIKEYGSENFDIVILAENIENRKIDEYEQFFIKRYNTLAKNKNGYNIAKGGNGGNLLEGKTEKEINQWKDKLSDVQKGKTLSEETKKLIGKANSYKIIQYSKSGTLIKEWDSMMDIQRELGFSQSKICLVCQYYFNSKEFLEKNNNHARLSAYGYLWKYKIDNNDIKKYKDTRTKKISQYTKDGKFIKIWNSFKEINDELNIDRREIYNVCNEKRKSARGFVWKYYEEV